MGQANAVGPTSIEGSSFSSNYISTLHAVGDLWSVAVYRRCLSAAGCAGALSNSEPISHGQQLTSRRELNCSQLRWH